MVLLSFRHSGRSVWLPQVSWKGWGWVRRRTRLVPRLYPFQFRAYYHRAPWPESRRFLRHSTNFLPYSLLSWLLGIIELNVKQKKKGKESTANHLALHGFNLNPPSKSAPWEEFRMKNRMRHSALWINKPLDSKMRISGTTVSMTPGSCIFSHIENH